MFTCATPLSRPRSLLLFLGIDRNLPKLGYRDALIVPEDMSAASHSVPERIYDDVAISVCHDLDGLEWRRAEGELDEGNGIHETMKGHLLLMSEEQPTIRDRGHCYF